VLAPLRFHVCIQGPGIWLGTNDEIDAAEIFWLPPSAFNRSIPLNDLATAAAARRHLPADLAGERHRAIEALGLYLEELDGMRRAGAPGPGIAWCQISPEERLAQLSAFGVRPVWSGGLIAKTSRHFAGRTSARA